MATTKSTTPPRKAAAKRTTTAKPRAVSSASKTAASTPASATTKRTTTKTPTAKSSASKPATSRTKADSSIVARTGRTIKERPFTSAAIATGAVTAVAAAAAGAYLLTRKDKSFKEASEDLTAKVKGGLASASETVKDGFASASETVKDLSQRGSDYLKGESAGSDSRTQAEIAEEALTLKQTGASTSPVDRLSATEIKTGAISY